MSEASILERINVARGNAEPEQSAPTEEPTAVNVSEDTPIEEEVTETVAETDNEELESVDEVVSTSDDEQEDLYVEYQGREINLKDIAKWEQGHLMQSDYTQKTQAVAEERKEVEALKASAAELQQTLNDKLASVEAILNRDTLSAEQLKELRDYDPEKFIEYNEKQDELKRLVNSKQNTPAFDVQAEQSKLWDSNPQWLDDGKQTEAFTKDMALLQDYAGKTGYVDSDVAGFRARDFETLIKAAKYDALQGKNAAIEKKVRKAPVTTKPRSSTKSVAKSALDKAQKAFNANPTVDNAVALRKVKRQLNN